MAPKLAQNDCAAIRKNEENEESEEQPLLRAIHTQHSLVSVASSRFSVETPRLAQIPDGIGLECKKYARVLNGGTC